MRNKTIYDDKGQILWGDQIKEIESPDKQKDNKVWLLEQLYILREKKFSSASLIFFVTIIAYMFAYYFNYGYYSYFQIPDFFIDNSFYIILKNIFNLIFFFMGLLTVSFAFLSLLILTNFN